MTARTCTKCGSSRLKLLDNHVWAGIRMERYKCLDCGQIQADDVRSRLKNAPKTSRESKEHFWVGCALGVLIGVIFMGALMVVYPLLALRFR